MKRWKKSILVRCAALVAATMLVVYAAAVNLNGRIASSAFAADEAGIQTDLGTLPEPVQRMLRQIILTAQTGDTEAMRQVLESNELKPMLAPSHVKDPIAYWKSQSVDGTGRDVLGAMLDILSSGFVLSGTGHDAMYVWPYFAEVDMSALTPAQDVELYRIVPPKTAKAMKDAGKYSYYRLGISPSGVWHYFIK